MVNPATEAIAGDSRRTGRVSRNRRDERLTRLFQKRDHLFAADARIIFEKVLDRVAAFEEVDQRVDGHAGTDKDRRAAEDFGVSVDNLFGAMGAIG
jgi:hypothetical protein